MEAGTKTCPRCGAEVLATAGICKHCRHRFGEALERPAATVAPGTLSRPTRPKRVIGSIPPVAWIVAALVGAAVIAALALSSGGDDAATSPSQAPSSDAIVSGAQVEERLQAQLESRTGDPVDGVSCPDGELSDGESVACDVTFTSGRTQGIVVAVSGSRGDVSLAISLP